MMFKSGLEVGKDCYDFALGEAGPFLAPALILRTGRYLLRQLDVACYQSFGI